MIRFSERYSLPVDSFGIVYFIIKVSPKLAYAVMSAIECWRTGKKILIYVNYPLTSM